MEKKKKLMKNKRKNNNKINKEEMMIYLENYSIWEMEIKNKSLKKM